jgi:hypothetical protein
VQIKKSTVHALPGAALPGAAPAGRIAGMTDGTAVTETTKSMQRDPPAGTVVI